MTRVSIALVHHPVVDRGGDVITTAITNLDLHDIARTACTYDLEAVWIVHPVAAQRELAERVRAHWVGGSGARRIPTREAALSLLRVVPALDDVTQSYGGRGGVEYWATAARALGRDVIGFDGARARITERARPVVIVLGTGWGLASSVVDDADVLLAPIDGLAGYNHLSVRAAAAITLDRLLGPARG